LNQTVLDWAWNIENHFAAIEEAVKNKSDLLLLSELSITGYEANDYFAYVQ
jgi:predicted amidohydrolase